jgi:hypothetical protein
MVEKTGFEEHTQLKQSYRELPNPDVLLAPLHAAQFTLSIPLVCARTLYKLLSCKY